MPVSTFWHLIIFVTMKRDAQEVVSGVSYPNQTLWSISHQTIPLSELFASGIFEPVELSDFR